MPLQRGNFCSKPQDRGHARFLTAHRSSVCEAGRGSGARPIGALIGETDGQVGGMPIYQSHVIRSDAFSTPPPERASRSKAPVEKSLQDKEGWHTFERGDKVEYTCDERVAALREGESAFAYIYGIAVHDREAGTQGRKFLILYEEGTGIFFAAYCSRWRRVQSSTNPGPAKFDVDNSQYVESMEADACIAMNDAWPEAVVAFSAMATHIQVKNQADKPPPKLIAQRAAQKKREDEKRKHDEERAREETRKAKEAEKEAKAKAKAEAEAQAQRAAAAAKLARIEARRAAKKNKGKGGNQKADSVAAVDDVVETENDGEAEALGDGELGDGECEGAQMDSPPLPPPRIPPAKLSRTEQLPEGWKAARDPTGRTYYYNKATSATQYERPGTQPQASSPLPPPSTLQQSMPQQAGPSAMLDFLKMTLQQSMPQQAGPSAMLDFLKMQRLQQIAKLRAEMPYAQGDRRGQIAGEIAQLEMQLACNQS